MPQQLLDELAKINQTNPVIVEYGAETSHNSTLQFINRCHTWEDAVDAVNRTHEAGIAVGLHFILGLPGENEEMILNTVDKVSELPIDTIKFHQLQLVRGTRMALDVEQEKYSVPTFTVDQYIDLCSVNQFQEIILSAILLKVQELLFIAVVVKILLI